MVDDLLLDKKNGVVRRAHACKKLPAPVLVSEKPWDQDLDGKDQRVYVYVTVLRDPNYGPAALWYNRGTSVLYTTSADAIERCLRRKAE